MSGRVQTDFDPVVVDGLTIVNRVELNLRAKAMPQYRSTRRRRQIVIAASARMVAVAMCNDRSVYGSPRVYEEISGRAVKAFGTRHDQFHALHSLQSAPTIHQPKRSIANLPAAADTPLTTVPHAMSIRDRLTGQSLSVARLVRS